MLRSRLYCLTILIVIFGFGLCPALAQESKKFKVLVVMSYHEDFKWVQEIRKGIDSALSEKCEIKYFYMDTYRNIEGGPQKAKDAYALYQEFQPDGVIAADDSAQSLFIVPYLKDKVKTPVMFCGVNDEAEKYGYPASNVSGILERVHITETLAFIRQIIPSVRTFGFIMQESASSKAVIKQINSESSGYQMKFSAFKEAKTRKDLISMSEELKKESDVIFISSMSGISDENGKTLGEKDAVATVLKTFGKPALASIDYMMKYGLVCAVVKTGQEQGETSADMLLKAMNGTPVSQIPITKNHKGMRMINVTALKAFGIKPDISILQSSEIVKTGE